MSLEGKLPLGGEMSHFRHTRGASTAAQRGRPASVSSTPTGVTGPETTLSLPGELVASV